MNSNLLQSRDILKMLIGCYQIPVAVLDMQGNFWMHNINMHKEVEAGNCLKFKDNKIHILDKHKNTDKLKNIELNYFLNNIDPDQNVENIGSIKIEGNKCLNINVVEINKASATAFKVILVTLAEDGHQSIQADNGLIELFNS